MRLSIFWSGEEIKKIAAQQIHLIIACKGVLFLLFFHRI